MRWASCKVIHREGESKMCGTILRICNVGVVDMLEEVGKSYGQIESQGQVMG